MDKVWQKNNNDWYLRDISGNVEKMENTIYTLEADPNTGELYLNNTGDTFKFDFKLYGLKSDLINRVLKYYKNSTGNLGVLLNGVKGTGKTITGKILANELGIPIIIISKKLGGMLKFLSQIDTDLVIFIDEYDKIFDAVTVRYNHETDTDDIKEDNTLLTLMDGVFSGLYRRTFILTTNELYLNENMLNRPGRIRYKETFTDLERTTIEEIIDDLLTNKSYRESILEFVKGLKLITVDIIKAIVTEVNIFDEDPIKCCASMNLEFLDTTYAIYEVSEKGKTRIEEGVSVKTYQYFLKALKRNHKTATISINGIEYNGTAKYEEDQPITVREMYDPKAAEKQIIFVEEDDVHSVFINKGMLEVVL